MFRIEMAEVEEAVICQKGGLTTKVIDLLKVFAVVPLIDRSIHVLMSEVLEDER